MKKKEQNKLKLIVVILIAIPLTSVAGLFMINFLNDTIGLNTDISRDQTIPLTIESREGAVRLNVLVADSPEEQTRGLMFVNSLPEDQGMLFIFQKESMQGFWMKNTYISLDIIFINSKKEIINIAQNTTPLKEDVRYSSDSPSLYVLEVNAGFSARHDLKSGDSVNF